MGREVLFVAAAWQSNAYFGILGISDVVAVAVVAFVDVVVILLSLLGSGDATTFSM